MSRLFGTDGVRGIANSELTPQMVFTIGRAQGAYLRKMLGRRPRVAVGRDTRISGELLEAAYCAGICSSGADVTVLGVIPTPGAAWYAAEKNFDGGAVISASHNPVRDNGIKLLGRGGMKLADDEEDALEALAANADSIEKPSGSDVGRIFHCEKEAVDAYIEHLVSLFPERLDGMKIVLDCANGASSVTGPAVFKAMGADITVINAEPTGLNINENCGSTHLAGLCEAVKKTDASLGLAFDGDADRCLACDENGTVIDGDQMMLIFAMRLRDEKRLPGNILTATVMSNLGLEEACAREKLVMRRTKVGDRYVLADMRETGSKLGGEQSGHIILGDYASTGDGVLSGLFLALTIKLRKSSASALAGKMIRRPQCLENVKVKDKHTWADQPEVKKAADKVEAALKGRGRLLIRASGTENLLRVMAEGPDEAELKILVGEIVTALNTYFAPSAQAASRIDSAALAKAYISDCNERMKAMKEMAAVLKRFEEGRDLNKLRGDAETARQESGALANTAKLWRELGDRIEEYVKAEETYRQVMFIKNLRELCAERGISFSPVASGEYRLGDFTLVPDYAKGKCALSYARLAAGETSVDSEAALKAMLSAAEALNSKNFDAAVFFDNLASAYRRALGSKPFGERVDIAAILPEMAFLHQDRKFFANPVKETFRPYTRVQFAWDIARMKQAIGLAHGGLRLNFGAATMNTTKNKDNVLYLEAGGAGQYYLTLWFTKA